MLVVDGAGKSGAQQLPDWEGLEVSSVAADRGNVVPTDLVVSINLRWASRLVLTSSQALCTRHCFLAGSPCQTDCLRMLSVQEQQFRGAA